jgi:peptidoglycan/LPS O-acetylase OafA/YrhL
MTSTMPRTAANFRPEIQSLRALAVILVVLYHLSFAGLDGGYVGVDVFFVISGYLITAHLLREATNTGSISLARFWARRIRRLLPAAITVLVLSAVATMIWVPKSLWQQTAQELGASALYVQNWLLASNSVDYLAAENSATLVQHFWSLSVEEQFYIAWPLILIAALWIAHKISRRIPARSTFAVALIVIAIASFVYSVYVTSSAPSIAYFSTPARAWEFAAGGIVAVLALETRFAVLPDRVRSVVAWAGLALMVVSAVWFTAATPFPGSAALLPVVGAILFIIAGNVESAWSPGYLNGFKPIQVIGDLSYGIYLWHWPLIMLYPYVLGNEPSSVGKIVIVLSAIVLAAAMKKIIEDPIRHGVVWKRKLWPSFAMGAAGMVVVIALASTQWINVEQENEAKAASVQSQLEAEDSCFGAAAMVDANGCGDPYEVTDDVDPAFAKTDIYEGSSEGTECHINESTKDSSPLDCVLGDTDNPSYTIALVGDSHAGQIRDALANYAEDNGIRLVVHSRSGCAGFESTSQLDESQKGEPAYVCAQWASQVRDDVLNDESIDLVLFANRTELVPSDGSVSAFWKDLVEANKDVVALRDFPGMPTGESGSECLENADSTSDPCSADRSEVLPKDDSMLKAADSMGDDVTVVDMSGYFCDEDECHAVIGGVPVYADDDHITLTYASTLIPYLARDIEKVLSN